MNIRQFVSSVSLELRRTPVSLASSMVLDTAGLGVRMLQLRCRKQTLITLSMAFSPIPKISNLGMISGQRSRVPEEENEDKAHRERRGIARPIILKREAP